jgi:RNA polymerase sigma factor (sigma-70 family)
MATGQIDRVIHHLRKAVLALDGAELTDGQLLESYITRRDETAFETLVRRHGPMVYGVCRRSLGNPHDAEDAFQATFLVLVRKAESVVPREMVASWLYGVARTTAQRSRAIAARRRVRERQVLKMPEPATAPHDPWNDLRSVLDRELQHLPEKYRVPIIVCDLEGHSIKEAARRLCWPQGTLAGRLARARALLARRLGRHGLQVTAAALAALLAENVASAGVPARAVAAMLEAVRSFAAGPAVSGAISIQVASLTQGVLNTMLLTKIKTVTTVVLLCAIGIAVGARVCSALAQQPTQGSQQAPNEPPPVLAQQPTESTRPTPPPAAAVEATVDGKGLLPSGPTPSQALVSLDKGGQLIVRMQLTTYEPTTRLSAGRMITSYKSREEIKTSHYSVKSVFVYDMKGASVDSGELANLLKHKVETPALVTSDQIPFDPLQLRLYKEGTLLFVLPTPPMAVPPLMAGAPTGAAPPRDPRNTPPQAPAPVPAPQTAPPAAPGSAPLPSPGSIPAPPAPEPLPQEGDTSNAPAQFPGGAPLTPVAPPQSEPVPSSGVPAPATAPPAGPGAAPAPSPVAPVSPLAPPPAGERKVGGNFLWLNSVEYQLPILANDRLCAIAFVKARID